MDTALALVQIATLIALIIYVIKTWHIASASERSTEISEEILKEMKESRDQEVAPYVVTYFDVPYGKHMIHFVVKNVGRSIAKNVKIEFEPPLGSSLYEIHNTPLVNEGISSIPPGYEIRTLLDTTISYFEKKLPLTYKAKVSYYGGLQPNIRSTEQIMDLTAFKGLVSASEKGVHELVKEVEKLVKSNNDISKKMEIMADSLTNGIWLKNPEFLVAGLQLEPEVWKSISLAKLIEFKMLWTSVYGGEQKKLLNPFLDDLKNRCTIIGSQILIIASKTPSNIPSELTDRLVEIAVKLSELGNAPSYIVDGGKSAKAFDTLGIETINLIDQVIEQIKTNCVVSNKNG